MKLHEHMSDAVADVHTNTETLTRTARDRGGRIRRQRRLGTIGGVAAVGILAFGIATAIPGNDPAPSQEPFASGGPAAPEGETVPIDGRSTTAALRAAVLEVMDGDTTAYAGQDDDGGLEGTYGVFELTPASGGGPGVVGLNIQHASMLEGDPIKCRHWMFDCTIQDLPGGALLRTYSEPPEQTTNGDGQRVVAEYFSIQRDLRVVASATNGFDLSGDAWDVTREEPVLSIDQLVEVVTQEWWDFRLPARFAEEGAELSPYQDVPVKLIMTSAGPELR